MKFFNIYSNIHSRELCPESGEEIFTSVVDAETVNPIRPGAGGRSSKNPRSSGITILNTAKTSIRQGGEGRSSSLNYIHLFSVEDDPCPAIK